MFALNACSSGCCHGGDCVSIYVALVAGISAYFAGVVIGVLVARSLE